MPGISHSPPFSPQSLGPAILLLFGHSCHHPPPWLSLQSVSMTDSAFAHSLCSSASCVHPLMPHLVFREPLFICLLNSFSLFLRISYIYAMKKMITSTVPCPPPPHGITPVYSRYRVFMKYNSLSAISAAHMCMGMAFHCIVEILLGPRLQRGVTVFPWNCQLPILLQ